MLLHTRILRPSCLHVSSETCPSYTLIPSDRLTDGRSSDTFWKAISSSELSSLVGSGSEISWISGGTTRWNIKPPSPSLLSTVLTIERFFGSGLAASNAASSSATILSASASVNVCPVNQDVKKPERHESTRNHPARWPARQDISERCIKEQYCFHLQLSNSYLDKI